MIAERFFFQGRRFLAGLLLASTVFGAQQAEAQVAVSNETMNFETGRITWNWACADHALLRYRYDTAGSYSTWMIDVGLGTDITTNLITNRDYVEANIQLSPDSGCGMNTINGTTISYTATTLSSTPASLSDTNLNTATLTVTLGDDEVERTGATSPKTWASGAATSHFSLATEAITGLSISNVTGITTGGSTATVTLAFSGEVSAAATVAVQVAAAAHSGANAITSRPVSVAASPGFSVSESSLLLDEAPGAVNAHRGGYEVRINTQPASSCASGVVLSIASDNADITASPSTLTFTNSNYAGPRRVTVLAARDSDSSTDSATLSHTVTTACTPDYPASMTVNSVSVTARDDDRRLVVTPAELALEEGSTGSYTVALGGSPAAGATVKVTATSANSAVRVDSDGTPRTRVLNFTSANWNTAQTVTVTAANDGDAADEFSTIANAAPEAIWQPFDLTVRVADDEETGTDYDTDDDGLIEIATLAHLNAVRWDLDGDGAVDSATNATSYGEAFPNAAADMGCPDGPDADQSADCIGYELAAKLDFDTDGDGDVDGDDPGSYANWSPIGGTYAGIFEGNGRTISRLTISTTGKAGLFDTVTGTVRRLGIVDANIRTTGAQNAGALVADVTNPGQIVACWSSGAVTGTAGSSNVFVGGLVGLLVGSNAKLAASFSTAAVSGTNNGGGLLGGIQEYATVIASYSTGTVTANRVGGLVGGALQGLRGDTTLRASYAIGRPTGVGSPPRVGGLVGSITGDVRSIDMYFDSTTTARTNGAGSGTSGTGQTTSQLQTPTSATGIYANWDELDIDGDGAAVEDPWDFGSGTQYPVLSYAGLDTALQFNSQGTNSAPTFGSGSVTNQTYRQSHPISQLQVPAATGGNGAITYTAYGLPAGLSFDGDGSGACSQARTICGSPTTVGNSTVRIVATDQDDTDASDRDALTFTVNVVNPTASITATNPSPLVEGTLNNATLTVTLTNTTFTSGVTVSSFMLGGTAVPGLTIASVAPVSSGDTSATLTLGYDGSNFDDQRLLGVTVEAAAHALVGDLSTGLVDLFPTRGLMLSAPALLVPENDNADYSVRLASIPFGGNVTVAITGAGSGISASPTSLVFTPSNWNRTRTVRVSAVDDMNPNNEVVTLTHTPSGGGYAGVPAATLQVTATDNDAPSLLVRPTQLQVDENDSGTYSIRLNTQPTGSVTVTVSGAAGAVTVDTDAATGNQNTLTFTQTTWSMPQMVTVTAGDDDNAANEMLTLSHGASGGDYGSLPSGSLPGVTVRVQDDDEPAILIDADPSTANQDERGPLALNEQPGHADNAKNYTVRLATEPTASVMLEITSGDRAVHVDTDATPRTKTLTFTTANWSDRQTVTATAAEDFDASDERVSISHRATGGDYEGLSASLAATTADNDEPEIGVTATALIGSGVAEGGMATYVVRLQTEPDGMAVVAVAASGGPVSVDMDGGQAGLQSSLRFDATNWQTPRMVTVRGLQDDDGASGTALLRHSASGADYGRAPAVDLSFAVTDDDAPAVLIDAASVAVNEGSSATYGVRLATAPFGGPAMVAAASSDEAVATVSPSLLRFTASNWNVAQRVRVLGVPDGGDSDGSATIMHAVSGADYEGVSASPVSVSVRDDEAAGVRIEPPLLSMAEGGTASYQVRLNTAPSGDVTVRATSGSTELALLDGARNVGTLALRFTPGDWSLGQEVEATSIRDGDADDDATTVTHTVAGYAGVSSAPALQVRVADVDALGIAFSPAAGLSLAEGDPSAMTGSYAAVLTVPPTGTVTISIASDDAGLAFDADGGNPGDQTTLSFTALNWNLPQMVAARAVADGDAASETATLLHSASGGGYDGVSAAYAVRLADADAAGRPTNVRVSAEASGLRVSWRAGANAEEHLVQWRTAGQAWSAERQLRAASGASAMIRGLRAGIRYEVRVIGVNRGWPGEPSETVGATPGGGLSPEVAEALADLDLDIGEFVELDLSAAFRDPEGATLTYAASSSNAAVARARLSSSGDRLVVEARAPGAARVTVTATNAGGLSASQSFMVRAGVVISLAGGGSAPEGGTLRLRLVSNRPAPSDISVPYALVAGADPSRAADEADHDGGSGGTAILPAGASEAAIEIAILDDDEVEPPREFFAAVLSPPGPGAGYGLGFARRAEAVIEEGVCDRSAPVRDALRGRRPCAAVADVSSLLVLNLARRGIEAPRAEDFLGLSGLRVLDLSGNRLSGWPGAVLRGLPHLISLRLNGNRLAVLPADALAAHPRLSGLHLADNALSVLPPGAFRALPVLQHLDLSGNLLRVLPRDAVAGLGELRSLRLNGNLIEALPAGLFEGVSGLRELQLQGNPGAPFALTLELARTDGDAWAPAPASVAARVAEGAPFALRSVLLASGGVLPEGVPLEIAAGGVESAPATVPQNGAPLVVARLQGAPPLPDAECEFGIRFRPCFQGLATAAGAPLALFKRPPGAPGTIEDRMLLVGGDALRIDLADWFEAAEGEILSYSAESSDPSAVRARIEDGMLILDAVGEGRATVRVTATDADGLSATLRFEARAERTARTRWRGWRLILLEPESGGR